MLPVRMVKLVLPQRVRRFLRVWRESRIMAHRPDRKLLVGRILPALSKPGVTILWVGCQPYTQPYIKMIERRGAVCCTLEIDPAAAAWGHPRRHLVGDLQSVARLYQPRQFAVALVNGIFGYGVDTRQGQEAAVKGLAQVIKPGGILMLGWNTDRSFDPMQLPAVNQFFIRAQQPGFEQRITFPKATHVYDFLTRLDR